MNARDSTDRTQGRKKKNPDGAEDQPVRTSDHSEDQSIGKQDGARENQAHELKKHQLISSRSSFGLGITILVLAAIAITSWAAGTHLDSGPMTSAADTPTQLSVAAMTVQPQDAYSVERRFPGQIVARRTVNLSFERSARVETVQVDEGERVITGTVLSQLDVTDLNIRQRIFDARIEQARASLDELESGPRNQTIAAAGDDVNRLIAETERARREQLRQAELLERHVISDREFETAQFGLAALEAQKSRAENMLAELKAGTRPEVLRRQKAILDELLAERDQIDNEITKSRLIAPFDGVVTRILAEPGAISRPGEPVMSIVENRNVEAWLSVPPAVGHRLIPGTRVDIELQDGVVPGIVRAQMWDLDLLTRTMRVIITLDEYHRPLVPNEVVGLRHEEIQESRGFWVPVDALNRDARGLWAVAILEAAATERTFRIARELVEVLHTDGDRAYVRGPLQDGEMVIRSGLHRIVPGQLVRIAGEQAASTPRAETTNPNASETGSIVP